MRVADKQWQGEHLGVPHPDSSLFHPAGTKVRKNAALPAGLDVYVGGGTQEGTYPEEDLQPPRRADLRQAQCGTEEAGGGLGAEREASGVQVSPVAVVGYALPSHPEQWVLHTKPV